MTTEKAYSPFNEGMARQLAASTAQENRDLLIKLISRVEELSDKIDQLTKTKAKPTTKAE